MGCDQGTVRCGEGEGLGCEGGVEWGEAVLLLEFNAVVVEGGELVAGRGGEFSGGPLCCEAC